MIASSFSNHRLQAAWSLQRLRWTDDDRVLATHHHTEHLHRTPFTYVQLQPDHAEIRSDSTGNYRLECATTSWLLLSSTNRVVAAKHNRREAICVGG